jgi:hypothetical protein
MSTSTTRLLTGVAGLAVAAGALVSGLPAAQASTPACGNADLSSSYRHSDDGLGHSYGWIVLKNTSGHTCHTGGYGGVSYVGDGNGTQIGAAAVRIDGGQVKTFVLQPGQRLRSPVDEVDAFNFPPKRCHRAHVDGFRVYVPNATLSQYVKHPTTGCRNTKIELIFQKPYRRP